MGAPQDAPSAPQAPQAPAELSRQAGSAAAPPPAKQSEGERSCHCRTGLAASPTLWERRSASIAPAPLLRGGSGLMDQWERCRRSQNGDCAPKRAPGTVTGERSEMGWGVSAPSQHPALSGAATAAGWEAGREGPGATSSRPAELLAAGRAAQLARSFNHQLSGQLEAGAGFLLHEPCS